MTLSTPVGVLWGLALGLGVLAFLAEQFPVEMANGTTYSVSFVVTIAAIVTAGPAEAIVATLLGTLSLRNARGRSPIRHLFNASQLAISAGLAGLVYEWAGGIRITSGVGSSLLSGSVLGGVLVPLLACTAVNFLANTLLVSGAVAISEKRSMIRVWRSQYAGLIGTYVAFALLGLLLGLLYRQVSWASVLFLLMPLLVARHAFQAAITMQGAFDKTVRSLVEAIEAKVPYTRGHAERVSRLAEWTARAYGLSEPRCRAIRYAALMHDVGKLTILGSVLRKTGKLTDAEYDHMKIHPERGVEIISEIDLLEEAIEGVRHHHERIDGRGYPDGLSGDAIPLFARLISVADAFDSMTSTRTYRKAIPIQDALVELRRCMGSQFDGRAVAALEKALAKRHWEPTTEEYITLEEEGDGSGAYAASL